MRAKMVLISIVWLLFVSLVFLSYAARADSIETVTDTVLRADEADTIAPFGARPLVYTMTIDGAIGAVTDTRIEGAIEQAEDDDAALLVIQLDTPGGFTRSTWSICKNILNANVPVCMYIAPKGARAGSAGVYMTYAAHIAAMAPSTNIGAAHPVSGGGEKVDSLMNEKITNDAVAQIKAAAAERGRNAEWAEQAVRESVSITDREALELNVIDLRAENIGELLDKLDGRKVELPHGPVILNVRRAQVEDIPTSFVHRILQIVTQPDIALILFSLGSLGIMIELYNPGSILPGVVGAICLILAFYSFQTLPINYAGLALIVLAVILFIAEIKIVSHGVLTVGGLIAFFFGGIMLVDTVDPDLQISRSLLITMVALIALVMALVIWLVAKAHGRQVFVGDEGMIGKQAVVRQKDMVYVDGALWKFESADSLNIGDKVAIVAVESLTLKVKKIEI